MAVTREIVLTATRENGEMITLGREFKGLVEIVKSYFMTTQAIVAIVQSEHTEGKFYITNRHSYYFFYKGN